MHRTIQPRRKPRAIALVVVAMAAIAAPGAARADAAAASVLFDEGKALFEGGRYDEARDKLQASYELSPLSGTAGLLAACHERTGKLASAWASYRDSAVLAERTGNPERADFARAKAAELEPRLARLQIDPPRPPIRGLSVMRNDERIPGAALATAVPVDAGRYVVIASAPDHQQWVATVDIADGERRVIAIPALRPIVAAAPAVSRPAVSRPTVSRPAVAPRRRTQAWIGLGLAGAGGAAVLAGGGFGIAASSAWSDAEDRGCTGRGACPDERTRELAQTAADRANLATVLVGGGLALAATGLILFWTAPDGDEEAAPSAGVSAAVGGDRFTIALEGRF